MNAGVCSLQRRRGRGPLPEVLTRGTRRQAAVLWRGGGMSPHRKDAGVWPSPGVATSRRSTATPPYVFVKRLRISLRWSGGRVCLCDAFVDPCEVEGDDAPVFMWKRSRIPRKFVGRTHVRMWKRPQTFPRWGKDACVSMWKRSRIL